MIKRRNVASVRTSLLSFWMLLLSQSKYFGVALSNTNGQYESSSTKNKPSPSSPIHTLILTRHGDSIWNGGQPGCQETFTGWTDVPLSEKGVAEAKALGTQVARYEMGIDACFTSVLQRAQLTAHHCLWAFEQHPHTLAPQKFVTDYRLNERHYGALQGLVKQDVEQGKYGHNAADVQAWRRSWHAVPPLLGDDDARRQTEVRRWQHYCGGTAEAVPRGESLAMVAAHRIKPFVDQVLTPLLTQAAYHKYNGKNNNNFDDDTDIVGGSGLIVAHANSLRALIGVLCQVEQQQQQQQGDDDSSLSFVSLRRLEAIKIPTGVPLVLRYRTWSDGSYEMCEFPSICDTTHKRALPHLPLWPLSALPRVRTKHNIPVYNEAVGDAAAMRHPTTREKQLSSSLSSSE
eukprot:scaffold6550_cov167-Amphora_coffeaeformis.AAC.2